MNTKTTNRNHNHKQSKRNSSELGTPLSYLPAELLQSYGKWVKEQLDQGWEGYLFTFMFKPLSGSVEAQVEQMHQEISTVYARLATRVVRNPASEYWAQFLPKCLFFPDFPVSKRIKQSRNDVCINDGLHFHGIVLAKRTKRLSESLNVHFDKNKEIYLTDKIQRIHSRQISHQGEKVLEYGGKSLKRRRISAEHILVLPRSIKELSKKPTANSQLDPRAKAIRAIQASTNVSDEVAQELYSASSVRKRQTRK